MHWLIDLIWFHPWWVYPIAWLAVTWLLAVPIMRFAPRHCPTTYSPGGASSSHTVNELDEKCAKNHHFHVRLREYGFFYALAWPLLLAAAIPAAVIAVYFLTMFKAAELGEPSSKRAIQ